MAKAAKRARSSTGAQRRKAARGAKTASKSTRRKTTTARGSGRRNTKTTRRWSQRVTEKSDALDLKQGVFTLKDPHKIAASLKRSAQASHRRKADPFRSALSMLTFYINRAGKTLPASRRKVLMQAKDELRRQFGRA